MYGTCVPRLSNRFMGTKKVDYFGMMETLYKRHVDKPELNIPKMVEDAIRSSLDKRKFTNPYLYISYLIDTFNIIFAHLLEVQDNKATFDISKKTYDLVRDILNKNKDALQEREMWEEMIEKNQTSLERGSKRSIL